MADQTASTASQAPAESSWALWDRQKTYRYIFEQQWHLNLAFLIGKHYAVWNNSTRRLEDAVRTELGRPGILNPKRTRVVSNHIMRLWRQKLSEFLRMKPSVDIAAFTQETLDIKSAEIAQQLALALQHKHEFQAMERRRWTLMMVFGQASLYPCWNPKKGPAGDEELILLTPFETYWPAGRWPDPPQEVFVMQAMGVDEIAERYGKDVPVEQDIYASPVEQQIRFLLDQREEVSDVQKMARTLTHFKLPCKAYQRGLYRVEAKDGLTLYSGDLPTWYWDDEGRAHLPVVKFDFYDIPMTRYGQSFVEPLISPQREYNHKISRITDHFRKFSGKWAVPFGAGLKEPVNDSTGQILYYDPAAGGAPTALTIPGIPQSLFNDLARCKLDMEDLAASHDVSHATLPAGVKSGVAISNLQEGDSSQMAPVVLASEEQMAEVFRLLLSIVRHNYKEPRTLQIVGQDKRYQIPNFQGSQIVGQHLITVSMGSEYVFSKTTRQQHAVELFQANLIDRDEARRMIQLAEDRNAPKDVQLLAAKAAVENMLNDVVVEVHPFDDHALHLKIINEVRLDPEFQKQATEHTKMIFDMVADLHQQALLKELQARAAGPMGMAPTGPQPTPPLASPAASVPQSGASANATPVGV